jgi:monoamine oxidase
MISSANRANSICSACGLPPWYSSRHVGFVITVCSSGRAFENRLTSLAERDVVAPPGRARRLLLKVVALKGVPLNRRSFAQSLLGSIAASIVVPQRGDCTEPGATNERGFDCDVAIVGGGISGLYAGWRLMDSDPGEIRILGHTLGGARPRVTVFEGSCRIGGRLLSTASPRFPGVTCELGGMRFMPTQLRMSKLVSYLGLSTITMNTSLSFALLRGRHVAFSDFTNPDALPYQLSGEERGWVRKFGATSLMDRAVRDLIPATRGLHGKPLYESLQSAMVKDVPLFRWGFWNLMASRLSSEGFSLSRTLSGFDSLGENANAVDLIMQSLDVIPGTRFYLIQDGFEQIPWALQKKFEASGGKVGLGDWLTRFDWIETESGRGIRLTFRSGRSVVSRALVLAMPPHALQPLFIRWPILNNGEPGPLLDAVESIPLFKMFLLYPKPWWNKFLGVAPGGAICAGRSYSDTPIRQCWYWNSAGCPSSDAPAMIMVYCDMSNINFWEGLRFGEAPLPDPCNVPPMDRLDRNWTSHSVPKRMLAEMHRQILILHGVDPKNDEYPPPIEAAYKDWRDEPFGGAVHFWKRGFQSWKLKDTIVNPIPHAPVYVCGEAYSTNSTWAEGALETAEIALVDHFGVARFF